MAPVTSGASAPRGVGANSWCEGPSPPWYTRRATPSGSAAPRAPPTRSLSRGDGHQADVPTQEELPAQDARVSHPYGDARWSPGAQGTSSQGPQAPDSGSARDEPAASPSRATPDCRGAGNRQRGALGRGSCSGHRRRRPRSRGSPSRCPAPAVRSVAIAHGGGLRAAIAPLLAGAAGLDLVVSLPGSATEMPFANFAPRSPPRSATAARCAHRGARMNASAWCSSGSTR